VLAADQVTCARRFADPLRPRGRASFAGLAVRPDPATGCPVLADGIAYFGCAAEALHRHGDHALVIGRVLGCDRLRQASPLVFSEGRLVLVDSLA
jgi:flavin reductase (DIM6/NTAB) family NADH-FMN oxidoreductase RutF